jgi:methionyl-tRNA formyltransferase
MIAAVKRPIGSDDTSDGVERDLAVLGAHLLVTVVDAMAAGPVMEEPQNDAAATYAPRLTKEEGRLDFTLPALAVHNRIRGLRPWPAAYTYLKGVRLVVHQARVSPHQSAGAAPGTCITADAAAITVACGDGGAVDVLQVQPEGRRVMTVRDFLAGHGRLTGQQFG